MSKESEEIMAAISKGELPVLDIAQTDNSSNKGSGVELSQRGIQKTFFGLQSLTENFSQSKDSKTE